jgi:hypothetical protein
MVDRLSLLNDKQKLTTESRLDFFGVLENEAPGMCSQY